MASAESDKMECDFAAIADYNVLLPFSSSSSFVRDVSYSCGSCGYELNLNSCNRNISAIDSKYGKSMKRGVISFFSIDESKFTQLVKSKSATWDGISACRTYDIKICSLRPLSSEEYNFFIRS